MDFSEFSEFFANFSWLFPITFLFFCSLAGLRYLIRIILNYIQIIFESRIFYLAELNSNNSFVTITVTKFANYRRFIWILVSNEWFDVLFGNSRIKRNIRKLFANLTNVSYYTRFFRKSSSPVLIAQGEKCNFCLLIFRIVKVDNPKYKLSVTQYDTCETFEFILSFSFVLGC